MRTWKCPIVRADIGLPRRCEADAWEEETQAERSSREERSGGPAGLAATRAQALLRETVACRAQRGERVVKLGAAAEGVNFISLASLTLFPQIFCFAKSLREPYIRGRCPVGAEGVILF